MAIVFTTAQARASDAHAIATLGAPGLVLMENAGRGVVRAIRRALEQRGKLLHNCRVAVVCGSGQNGGDGFVIARHLSLMGASVHVRLALPENKVAGDALVNLSILKRMQVVTLVDASDCLSRQDWTEWLSGADVIVDAVFGTGLRTDVSGVPAVAICAMNLAKGIRVCVDLPSGLDADSGLVRGTSVNADLTVTMAAHKLGLLLDVGAKVGKVSVVGLGAPVFQDQTLRPFAHWLDEANVAAWLPRFACDAHKGTRGHLLLIAGSKGKTGAAALAGRAAMRAGAGYVTIATTRSAQAAIDAKLWEAMSIAFTESDDATDDSCQDLLAAASRMKSVAIGPGISKGQGMAALVRRFVVECTSPLVVDADALNHLGQDAAILLKANGPRILTPHPAEMARLLGRTVHDIQSDRLNSVRTLAEQSGAVVVLKGARTLVAEPEGTVYINPAASAALGTAGSGDVLTGVVGAFLAQGLSVLQAAVCGVFLHGMAGDDACREQSMQSLVAGDLPDAVARVQANLMRRFA
jgi:ADP-dependent NAD(P)H-hydrate dehydratase / NAD(P)H-hydrate epimerase